MKYVNHIATPNSVTTIFHDGKTDRVFTVMKSDPEKFKAVLQCIQQEAWDDIPQIVDTALALKTATGGKIDIDSKGQVSYNGVKMPVRLSDAMRALAASRLSTEGHQKFWDRLQANPTEHCRQGLYDYIAANDLTIHPDGTFTAWKAVNPNMTSWYDPSFQYKIGMNHDVKRVDMDPTRECGPGLHAAGWQYVKSSYSVGVLVELRLHPELVVSVPGTRCFLRSSGFELVKQLGDLRNAEELVKITTSLNEGIVGTAVSAAQQAGELVEGAKGALKSAKELAAMDSPIKKGVKTTVRVIKGVADSVKKAVLGDTKKGGLVIEPTTDRITIPGSVMIDAGFKLEPVIVFQTDKRAKFLVAVPAAKADAYKAKMKCVWTSDEIKLTSSASLSVRGAVLARTKLWNPEGKYVITSTEKNVVEIRLK